MKHRRKPYLVVACLLVIVAVYAATRVYVAQRPVRYEILDSRFGSSAWQPKELIQALGWRYKENNRNPLGLGEHEFPDFEHQALLRLIDLQQTHFGHPAPPRKEEGTYIDHSLAYIAEQTDTRIIVIGTGTYKPCHYDKSFAHGPEGYWEMERFVFSPTGELLSRGAHTTE